MVLSGCQSERPNLKTEPIPACDALEVTTVYDDFLKSGDSEKRIAIAGEVSDILLELSRSRDRFLSGKDPVDLFPALYFHTTIRALDVAMRSRSDKRPYLLIMVKGFYAGYRYNREIYQKTGASRVEKHWRGYYDGCRRGQAKQSRNYIGSGRDPGGRG